MGRGARRQYITVFISIGAVCSLTLIVGGHLVGPHKVIITFRVNQNGLHQCVPENFPVKYDMLF